MALAGHQARDPDAALARARAGLSDPEPVVRATALGALARLGALTRADIQDAAADPAPAVRARAAELAPGCGPDAAAILVALLHDSDPSVVEAAAFGSGELGPDAGEETVVALAGVAAAHPDPLCREAAVAAIGAIGPVGAVGAVAAVGPGSGLDAVLTAMGDKPAVRRRAVLALAAFEGPQVDAALEAARADRDWQVRQAAEDLTGRRPTS